MENSDQGKRNAETKGYLNHQMSTLRVQMRAVFSTQSLCCFHHLLPSFWYNILKKQELAIEDNMENTSISTSYFFLKKQSFSSPFPIHISFSSNFQHHSMQKASQTFGKSSYTDNKSRKWTIGWSGEY